MGYKQRKEGRVKGLRVTILEKGRIKIMFQIEGGKKGGDKGMEGEQRCGFVRDQGNVEGISLSTQVSAIHLRSPKTDKMEFCLSTKFHKKSLPSKVVIIDKQQEIDRKRDSGIEDNYVTSNQNHHLFICLPAHRYQEDSQIFPHYIPGGELHVTLLFPSFPNLAFLLTLSHSPLFSFYFNFCPFSFSPPLVPSPPRLFSFTFLRVLPLLSKPFR